MKKFSEKDPDGRKLFRPADIIPIILLLAAPLIYFFAGAAAENDGAYAEISCGGEIIGTVDLDINGVYSYPRTGEMEFTVSDGGIWVSKSDCPDKICMNTGRLCRAGETAVCVPNKVVVTVRGKNGKDAEDIDGFVR